MLIHAGTKLNISYEYADHMKDIVQSCLPNIKGCVFYEFSNALLLKDFETGIDNTMQILPANRYRADLKHLTLVSNRSVCVNQEQFTICPEHKLIRAFSVLLKMQFAYFYEWEGFQKALSDPGTMFIDLDKRTGAVFRYYCNGFLVPWKTLKKTADSRLVRARKSLASIYSGYPSIIKKIGDQKWNTTNSIV